MKRFAVACLLLLFLGAGTPVHDPISTPAAQWVQLSNSGSDVNNSASPSLCIEVPANARAGTRVIVRCVTDGLDAKTPISWKLPAASITDETGTYEFRQAVETEDNGRTLEIVWPQGGELTFSARAAEAIPTGDSGAQGQPIYRVVIVEDTAILSLRGGVADPDAPPIPTPPEALQSALSPVKAVAIKADNAKRSSMARLWADFATAVSTAGAVPKTTGGFKAAITHYTSAAGTIAGLQGAFPGFSEALEKSFVETFGSEDAALDKQKALAFAQAIAWACGAK